MKIYGSTDVGMRRRHNEDYYDYTRLLSVPPTAEGEAREEGWLAVVADGMGGALGGEIASKMAAEIILSSVKESDEDDRLRMIEKAIAAANRAIFERSERDENVRGMGCTLVVVLASEHSLAIAHVGDSRIYLSHNDRLLLLTRDHSYVQQLVDAGELSPEEARHSMHRNIITRAVGTHESVTADVAACAWEEGDRLLLCTDGLTGSVEDREIGQVLSESTSIEDAVRELIAAANARDCDDNLTAVVIENKKGETI
jgi:protein phosphatase